MIDLKTFDQYQELEKPKRLSRYVLILCSKGNVTIVIDDKELKLIKNQVVTITSGQIHHFKKLTAAKGFVLEFTLDFFLQRRQRH